MPIYLLHEDVLSFPNPRDADDETGVLAVGGDLSSKRLLLAYSLGVFPWYDETITPILWHSPAERFALRPDELHISRSLKKTMARHEFDLRFDTDFEQVLEHCRRVPRPGQDGTWLNQDMQEAYLEMHDLGFAHSAEAWSGDRLVGGLYGVTLGGVFFGESMFSLERDTSKIVFANLVPMLHAAGYELIDCQVYTEHLSRFGATNWSRDEFLDTLDTAIRKVPIPPWPAP